MRDQDVDRACIAQEEGDLLPMTLRWGSTPQEACSHEPLDALLRQEEPELAWREDDAWWDTDPPDGPVPRTRAVPLDDGDEDGPVDADLHEFSV